MRRLASRLGARGIVAAGLVAVVLLIVGVAKAIGGRDHPVGVSGQPQATAPASVSDDDDGEITASPTAYPDDATVRAAAITFTKAWLRQDLTAGAWHKLIAPLVTTTLAASLTGVDPGGVPAKRIVGAVAIVLRNEGYAQVTIPVDTGTVALNLLKQDGQWLIDAVDWSRL